MAHLDRPVLRWDSRRWLAILGESLAGTLATAIIGIVAFRLHFNLSAIGSVYLLLVVFTALRRGFVLATVVSVAAVFCINYLFTPPIFEFQIADPENAVAVLTFETAALVVSGLSSQLRDRALQVESQRARTSKLYELSRAILLIDGKRPTGEQLSALIQNIMQAGSVDLWVAYDADAVSPPQLPMQKGSARETYLDGTDNDDIELRVSSRVLKVGARPIGGMVLCGWETDSLLADAVASLAAVAFERARALREENRAEAERNTERLRTAVLDGLAHGFKTPLTAIQTASSGLLAIDPQLTPTQAELVSIIDEEATALSRLATRLLQTAALEAQEVGLRRSKISILSLLQDMLDEEGEATRGRVRISAANDLTDIEVDPQMIRLALLQLIDNAAKYSLGMGMIEVMLTQCQTETRIEVSNRGSSIKPEERERIFDRFYRGIEASHGPSGTGLGLSIVKKAAEAHGGRAWVECDDDTTRFFFVMEHYDGAKHG